MSAPVLLWLNGGPGSSSMFGLFVQNGPYYITKDGQLKLRSVPWTSRFSVLYVDNPVGTGYSFTDDKKGYARNETDVGRDLLEALLQFFTLFYEYAGNDFYVTGESYAGKYVPAVAYAIHTAIEPRVKLNLKGIAIGNAFIDPVSQLDYADYYYQLGLVDNSQANYMREQSNRAAGFIKEGRYTDAFYVIDNLIDGDFNDDTYFKDVTGYNYYYNYLLTEEPESHNYHVDFIQSSRVRDALHVGTQVYDDLSPTVEYYLIEDIMMSVKPWFETLLENYKVMLYSGQLDLNVPYPFTANFISTLSWSGAEAFKDAPRRIWRTPDGKDVAGYVRNVRNFTEVLVRNAGHLVPTDQPEVTLDMISRFIYGKSFSS